MGVSDVRRELRKAAANLEESEGRYIVNLYYQLQEHRKALRNQQRELVDEAMSSGGVGNGSSPVQPMIVGYFADEVEGLERQIPSLMDKWTDTKVVGRWAKIQKGIGPVLAAGLMAHIDFDKAQTAGAIWRYAGLDPSVTWNKGEKRPWNADLKVLCWKIGDSFVKVSGRDDAFYGQLYRQRKAQEVERNENGVFADQAAQTLREKNIKEPATRAAYEAGKLPAGRLDLRARRYAVKIFLSHYFEVGYREHHNEEPPRPFAIEHLGHVHKLDPPKLDIA